MSMRIAFMSDIHGVPSALEAALASADALGFDRLVLLGDLERGIAIPPKSSFAAYFRMAFGEEESK